MTENLTDKLAHSLKDLFTMMDDGLLVRDISKDHLPDFTMRMLNFVPRLKVHHDVLKEWESKQNTHK